MARNELKALCIAACVVAACGCGSKDPVQGPRYNFAFVKKTIQLGMTTDEILGQVGSPTIRMRGHKPGSEIWWFTSKDGRQSLGMDIEGGKVVSISGGD